MSATLHRQATRIARPAFLQMMLVSLMVCVSSVQSFPATPFSASYILSQEDISEQLKIFYRDGLMRIELAGAGQNQAFEALYLIDLANSAVLVFQPDPETKQKEFGLDSEPEGVLETFAEFTPLEDLSNPCPELLKRLMDDQGSCKQLGKETLSKRRVDHWQLTRAAGDRAQMDVWIDLERKLAVKIHWYDRTFEMKDIQYGPQSDELFEVPYGYHEVHNGGLVKAPLALKFAEIPHFKAVLVSAEGRSPVYYSLGRMRLEMRGGQQIILADVSSRSVLLLDPSHKSYRHAEAELSPWFQFSRPLDPNHPCAELFQFPGEAECKRLGFEDINGRPTIKWEISKPGSSEPYATIWIDRVLHFALKDVRRGEVFRQLQDISQPVNIPDALFDVPSRYTEQKSQNSDNTGPK